MLGHRNGCERAVEAPPSLTERKLRLSRSRGVTLDQPGPRFPVRRPEREARNRRGGTGGGTPEAHKATRNPPDPPKAHRSNTQTPQGDRGRGEDTQSGAPERADQDWTSEG